MDPNKTLSDIRELLTAIESADEHDPETTDLLAGRVSALDEWISHGGLLPNEWCPTHKAD